MSVFESLRKSLKRMKQQLKNQLLLKVMLLLKRLLKHQLKRLLKSLQLKKRRLSKPALCNEFEGIEGVFPWHVFSVAVSSVASPPRA